MPYPIKAGGAQAQFNIINKLRTSHDFVIIYPMNQDNSLDNQRKLSELWPEVTFYPYPYYKQVLYLPFLFTKAKKYILRSILSKKKSFLYRALDQYRFNTSFLYKKFLRNIICLEKPDIIQAEFFPNININTSINTDVPVLFVHHEIAFVVHERMVEGINMSITQKEKLQQRKNEEIDDLNKFNAIITLTEIDQKILYNAGVHRKIFVSPAAVNAKLYNYREWENRIVYIGGYQHLPNKEGVDWFLDEVLPLVQWNEYSRIEFLIIGSGWPQYYEGERNGLKVKCLGFVEDFSDIVSGSIVIVPLLSGSGMRMKILDAAALGAPFISTSVGAEGLKFQNNSSCLLADGPKQFAESLEKLMREANLRKKIALQSQKIFEEYYSVEALSRVREDIYKIVLNNN